MNLITTIGTIFLELIATAIASISFLLFCQEYLKHRTAPSAWFAAASASLTATLFALFLSQFFGSSGELKLACISLEVLYLGATIHGLCVVQGAFLMGRMNAILRRSLASVCLIATAFVIYTFWGRAPNLQFINGITFSANGEPADIAGAVSSIAVIFSLLLLVLALKKQAKAQKVKENVSNLFLAVIIFGVLETISAFLQSSLSFDVFLFATLGALPIYCTLLTISALAGLDSDQDIKLNPHHIFQRDLLLKSMVGIASVMLIMAFSIQTIVSSIAVSAGKTAQHGAGVHLLDRLTLSYDKSVESLNVELAVASSDSRLMNALAESDPLVLDQAIADVNATTQALNNIQKLQVFRSSDLRQSNSTFSDSSVIKAALSSKHAQTGIESTTNGVWVLRSAAPLLGDDTGAAVAVVETPLSTIFDRASVPTESTNLNYGFVLPDGKLALATDSPLDRLTTSLMPDAAYSSPDDDATLVEVTDFQVMVRRLVDGSGNVSGYFYIARDNASVNASVFSAVSAVTFMIVTAMMISLAVVYLALRRILRPIKKLRHSIEKIENENYNVKVGGHGPDEVGQLAAAFDKMQETISKRTESLNKSLREQRDFVDHMVHELRNPVNIFRWTLEMMRGGDTGRLNKEQLELLEQLFQVNERLLRVTQNIQDTILIDRGTLKLSPTSLVVEDLIDEVAGHFSVRIRNAGITFHWSKSKLPLPRIWTDKTYILKTISVMISNATKYTSKGGHIEVTAELTNEMFPGGKKGKYVLVSVEDNGIGIPNNELHNIFSKFYRAKNVVKADAQGAGLGLYIAQNVIRRFGGELWIKSKEGEGTSAFFTIPVDQSPSNLDKSLPESNI